MKIYLMVLICIIILSACGKNNPENSDKNSSPTLGYIQPEVEKVYLKIAASEGSELSIGIVGDGVNYDCNLNQTCEVAIDKTQNVTLKIFPKDENYLLESWGTEKCSTKSLSCKLDLNEDTSILIKGERIDYISTNEVILNKSNRENFLDAPQIRSEISIPDHIIFEKGLAFGKRLNIQFDSGKCIYDGSVDFCGLTNCDNSKVLTLKSCVFADQTYKNLIDGTGYFYLPNDVRLKSLKLDGKIAKNEEISFSFNLPVFSWIYEISE